jgi:PAS domain S-box-containing protein
MFNAKDLLKSLSENGGEGYLAFDNSKRYIFWSKGMEVITGLSADVVMGRETFEVFPFLREVGFEKVYERVLNGETVVVEMRKFIVPESNRYGYFSARYSPLFSEDGKVTGGVGIVRDVTQEKEALERQHETESRFRNMADCSPVMLWMSGEDAMCNFFNSTWLQFTGRTLEQELGVGWSEGVHYEDFQGCMDIYLDAFNLRQPFEMEYRLKRHDGEYRWILDRARPRYTPGGNFAGYIGSCVDITERKTLEEDLKRAVRAREDFLSVASHELKTPLTALSLQLGLFQHLTQTASRANDVLDKVTSVSDLASKQMRVLSRLIESLLDVSRISGGRLQLDLQETDLRPVLNEVVRNLSEQARVAKTQLNWREPEEPVIGFCDRIRMEQVATNLLSNAIKYGEGRPVQVRLQESNGHVFLIVKDQGLGIPEEQQARIFDKFQRAKNKSKVDGLGLGLYIAKQIMEGHGGEITLQSEPGHGSTFTAVLPSYKPKSA